MDITVQAKVLWLTEDDMETMAEDHEPEPLTKPKFVWGPMTIQVSDIRFYWGQSKNRCVIECKDGRLILVYCTHAKLCEDITAIREEMYQRQVDGEFSEEEDLVLGTEEDTDTP